MTKEAITISQQSRKIVPIFCKEEAGTDVFAVFVIDALDLAVGSLDEAVLVDLGVGGQIGDQTDVGAFRRLDGAHTAVVGVVNVSDLEVGAVTAQTAGAQSGQTALVGQLSQGVVLIHELATAGRNRRTP